MTCRIIQIKEMKPQYDPGNGNPLSKAIFDEINLLFYEYGKGGDDNDVTKISAISDRPYKKTEHGYEYIELSKDTPQELMNIWILSWNRTSTIKIMNALLHYSGRLLIL